MVNGGFDIIRSIAEFNFDTTNLGRVEIVKDDILRLFNGEFEGYQRCDTSYHDFKHTLRVLVPYAQIIDGWNRSGQRPLITYRFFELGLIAALLHDTGFIKKTGDDEGTGAKYTFVHIARSIAFANEYLPALGFTQDEINMICSMILCTGVIDRINKVIAPCDEAILCGYALGTADLLGQMAAQDYPEKLPSLYSEFKEGYDYSGIEHLRKRGVIVFESEEALITNTPLFYNTEVQNRFKKMGSLDAYVKYHWPDRNDYYKVAIEKNISRVESPEFLKNIRLLSSYL